MNATAKVRQAAKAAIGWLECAELARQQGDSQAADYATERAGFESIKAFRVVQIGALS
jgi:hypothetical protein